MTERTESIMIVLAPGLSETQKDAVVAVLRDLAESARVPGRAGAITHVVRGQTEPHDLARRAYRMEQLEARFARVVRLCVVLGLVVGLVIGWCARGR